MSEEESFIGRGLEDIPGRPLGWAFHRERDEIRAHLRRRLWRFGLDELRAMRLEARVDAIQRRLHRNRPTLRERQAAWRARHPPPEAAPELTPAEWAPLAELFAGANDPLSALIGAKAAARAKT